MAADDNRLRTVDEHLATVLDGIGSIDPIELTLLDAQGLVLAEGVDTPIPLPGFDNSAMDGYAVRSVDTKYASAEEPITLPVIGDVAAGAKSRSGMGPGLAMRIMTGAPIPTGADAVIPLEDTNRGVARVEIRRPVRNGECIRRAGEDLAAGVAGARRRRRARPAADRPARRGRTGSGARPSPSPRAGDQHRQRARRGRAAAGLR